MPAKVAKPNSSSAVPGVDLKEVTRLLEFMNANGLEELEYDAGGVHIRLKKAATSHSPVPAGVMQALLQAAPPANPDASAAFAPAPAPIQPAGLAADLHVVKSPIVGTFYEGASPGAEPFVRVGSAVKPGQVLCIIEAMKLMNEIEADIAGEVVQILASNGQPVEYGEALFAIRTAGK